MRSNTYMFETDSQVNVVILNVGNCSCDMIIFLKLFCFWHRWCHRIWWWRQPQIWLEISPLNWRSLQWSFWVVPAGIAVGGVPHLGFQHCPHHQQPASFIEIMANPPDQSINKEYLWEVFDDLGRLQVGRLNLVQFSTHLTTPSLNALHLYPPRYPLHPSHSLFIISVTIISIMVGWAYLVKPFPFQVSKIFFGVGVEVEQILPHQTDC